ncbi:MAG: type II toxin-antitoxin system VapC family toxin [Methanosarcinales archaeon]
MSKYFMDVNIPMYSAGKPHKYKEPCSNILNYIRMGFLDIAIDTEIIQEILYRYHNIGLAKKGIELSGYLLALKLTILPVTHEDIILALKCYEKYYTKGVKPRDTIHVAVMINNNINTIISTDKHFDLIENIERIDPIEFEIFLKNTYR